MDGQPNIGIKHAISIIKMHLLHASSKTGIFSDELAFLEYFGVFSIFNIPVDLAICEVYLHFQLLLLPLPHVGLEIMTCFLWPTDL